MMPIGGWRVRRRRAPRCQKKVTLTAETGHIDCSKEDAIWFIPIKNGILCGYLMRYFDILKCQYDRGHKKTRAVRGHTDRGEDEITLEKSDGSRPHSAEKVRDYGRG